MSGAARGAPCLVLPEVSLQLNSPQQLPGAPSVSIPPPLPPMRAPALFALSRRRPLLSRIHVVRLISSLLPMRDVAPSGVDATASRVSVGLVPRTPHPARRTRCPGVWHGEVVRGAQGGGRRVDIVGAVEGLRRRCRPTRCVGDGR